MKKITIISIIILLFSISCRKGLNNQEQSCLPGFIWIKYVGITNHIKRFTLIRTLEQDSSFVSYYNNEWGEGFAKDSTFFNIYCNDYIANQNQFYKVKKYIISNNTYKKRELINMGNYNAVKIVIIDSCDSIEYIVNSDNKGYFSKMIDSLNIKDQPLIEYLEYYERIISDE